MKLNDGDTLELANHVYRYEQQGDSQSILVEEAFTKATMALVRSRKVVILVSDIRGFTGISESLPLDVLARTIGKWYSDCDQVLAKRGATVDKFIGDSVLAYWTSTGPKQRLSALKAAHDLLRACNRIYEEQHELFDQICHDFSVGVALHIGEVAYGGMSQGEFTLVGDSVNLTFRLESLTKTLDESVLATADFFESWPEGNEYRNSLGAHTVKGRDQPVEVCAITSFPEH